MPSPSRPRRTSETNPASALTKENAIHANSARNNRRTATSSKVRPPTLSARDISLAPHAVSASVPPSTEARRHATLRGEVGRGADLGGLERSGWIGIASGDAGGGAAGECFGG